MKKIFKLVIVCLLCLGLISLIVFIITSFNH